ncbi:SDR family oxidoreductase [Actinomycetospora lemnae]|uniref:SDR family NAD(P)-dependent oxidoreductase n=1 Tax=Actinomycetospora lemnae TaxID=3019891 RepID=A0ABT5SNS1_9PSEU|nr:SDR family NAD(P)-dependent oxidoreductase [Actinomycetospora sp. DW7H6]MDD7964480.1 SDR family NAD(P)-dependent oxidoreductase [Actinomycetospora sp. DW7H6]
MGALEGRRVLVTGASSGIGAAVARAAADAGAVVGLLARRADRLAALADEVGGHAAVADVTDATAVTDAVDRLVRDLGGLDAVVAAAGTLHLGAVGETDPQRWREVFDVNVSGLLATAHAALPHLGGGSSFVTISSMSGRRVPTAAGGVYAASKHAAHAVDETLRREAGPRGVRVTTVAPGFVATDLLAADEPGREDVRSFRERMHALGLTPEHIAAAVVHVLGLPPEVCVVEYALTSTAQQA